MEQEGPSVESLGRRARDGDAEALDALLRCLLPEWLRLAASCFNGDHARAEDAVQAAAWRFCRGVGQWRGDASIRTWGFRLVYNACHDEHRRRRRLVVEVPLTPAHEESVSTAEKVGRESEEFDHLLALVSPDEAAIVALRYREDLRLREIADVLAIPIGTVASRLRRALGVIARRTELKDGGTRDD